MSDEEFRADLERAEMNDYDNRRRWQDRAEKAEAKLAAIRAAWKIVAMNKDPDPETVLDQLLWLNEVIGE